MSQFLIYLLLIIALALPVLGAVAIRLSIARLSQPYVYGAAVLVFGLAIASVLLLAHSDITSLRVGGLSLLLPASAPMDDLAEQGPPAEPPAEPPSQPPEATSEQAITAIMTPTVATTATAVLTPEPSATAEPPTATPEPSATAEPPTATAEPPTATPEPPTATPEPARRTYVVKAGDTLRGIAAEFNVTVDALLKANNLTPAQADALQIGRELIIP